VYLMSVCKALAGGSICIKAGWHASLCGRVQMPVAAFPSFYFLCAVRVIFCDQGTACCVHCGHCKSLAGLMSGPPVCPVYPIL